MRRSALCLAYVLAAASAAAAEDASVPPLASGVSADDVSFACAFEILRQEVATASEDPAADDNAFYFVHSGAETLGPWTLIEIKRRIHLGSLPHGFWFRDAHPLPDGSTDAWHWSETDRALDPLPGDPALRDGDLGPGLRALLTGCWVADPIVTDTHEVNVLILLFENGVHYFHLSVVPGAQSAEGIHYSQPVESRWKETATGGPDFTLRMAEIKELAPNEVFPGRVIDRNTIEIEFYPGRRPVVLRRM